MSLARETGDQTCRAEAVPATQDEGVGLDNDRGDTGQPDEEADVIHVGAEGPAATDDGYHGYVPV